MHSAATELQMSEMIYSTIIEEHNTHYVYMLNFNITGSLKT